MPWLRRSHYPAQHWITISLRHCLTIARRYPRNHLQIQTRFRNLRSRIVSRRSVRSRDELGIPLAKLAREKLDYIDEVLAETLTKSAVLERVRTFFKPSENEKQNAK